MTQESLYVAVKMISTQLRACGTITIDLVRSDTLLAMYEYATQRSEAALATISMGIRAAYTIGLDVEPTATQHLSLAQHEMNRLWWTLVICERSVAHIEAVVINGCNIDYLRLFVLETRNLRQPLLTPFPPSTRPLPYIDESLIWNVNARELPSHAQDSVRAGFVRVIEATAFLDAALSIARDIDTLATHTDELKRIDFGLRSLLGVVLEECCGAWTILCGAIAIVIR